MRTLGIEVRAGLHAGEVELINDDIGGVAIHIAHRVSTLAGPSQVLVSGTVKDLVAGSGIEFADEGDHEAQGCSAPLATDVRVCVATSPTGAADAEVRI